MSEITAPRSPRIVIQQGGKDFSTLAEVFDNASQKLYPRLALYEALASYKKGEHRSRTRSIDVGCEYRRKFLDSFAYLCDIEKGGATVTAAGLQQLSYSNILWLAANEGIRKDVKIYAEGMLSRLQRVNQDNLATVEEDIFQLAVEKCSPRIEFYKTEMQRYATNCRMQLRNEMRDDIVKSLRSKLKKLAEPPPGMKVAQLIKLCYTARGHEVDLIKARSVHSDDDFGKLAHYIGRLGATCSSANTVVRATLEVSALRNISGIRTIEGPEPRVVTIKSEHMSPYEIVRAICRESTSQNPLQSQSALHAIVEHDLPFDNKIRDALTSRKTIITRVHAELQITDKFSRDKHMQFLDNDKYVGCSKPACYFCYNWICSHKHRYVFPATHHKIIAGCRGPDSDINEAGAMFLKDMYIKMCKRVDQDILEYLTSSPQGTQPGRHYMSTEGSSHPPSQV